MNKYLLVTLLLIFASAGYFFWGNTKLDSEESSAVREINSVTSPTRIAEINGYIVSIEGNDVVVANEVGVKEISEEERARRQKLTQEERQALKVQESAKLTKENISTTIPVGVSIVKGSGDASGSNVKAEMSEIIKGVYVSIWKNGDIVEFVKLKGVSQ